MSVWKSLARNDQTNDLKLAQTKYRQEKYKVTVCYSNVSIELINILQIDSADKKICAYKSIDWGH